MNSEKEKILNNAYLAFMDLMMEDLPLDRMPEFISDEVMGYGTTINEKLFGIDALADLIKTQRDQGQGLEMNWDIQPVHRWYASREEQAIFVDEVKIKMKPEDQEIELNLRLSLVFEYLDGTWKIVHWHGSKPEYDEGGADTWHIGEWKQKNEELQRMVDEQTADLEANNRELEIEASLERVRSRTMAMKRSEEMPEVANNLFLQVQELGFSAWSAGYCIWEKDKNSASCSMSSEGVIQKSFSLPTIGEGYDFSTQLKKGEKFYVAELGGEELVEHYKFMRKLPVVGEILDGILSAGFELPTFQIFHIVYFKHGYLMFITYEPVPKAHDIFKRFATVFEQTYTRFLDLQKAETQAREAHIETALEKVRSRSLAMHTSDELADTATILFEQLYALGGLPDRVGIWIINEENEYFEQWATNQDGKFLGHRINVPIAEATSISKLYDAWKEKKDHIIIDLKGHELKKWLKFVREDLKMVVDDTKIKGRRIHNGVFFSNGAFVCTTHEPVSNEVIQLLIRFAKVFEQTYTRFLDLLKAEEQVREAQIEAALERVRAKSMAMHKSEELADLSFELVKQVQALRVSTWFCAFNIYDDDDKGSLEWGSNAEGTYPKYRTPREGIFLRYYETGQRGETFLINEIDENECAAHYDYLCSLPGVGEQLLKMRDSGIPFPTSQIDHVAYFKYGYILFITFEPVPEAHDIFKRFAKVFEQTYTRFLDLQHAEEQAKEAQVELSLERIRAQVTAMKESSDLLDIVVIMNSEFRALGHEAHYFWHMRWLQDSYEKAMTSGDGSRIAMVMELPRGFHENAAMNEWEKNTEPSIVVPFDVEGAIDYVDKMVRLGRFSEIDHNAPRPDDIRAIGGLTFVMARTTHGEIGYSLPGKVTHPPEEDIATLVRFAGVFDLAYRRFEDLKDAEQRNRETQIELALERVRSKTMAMHNSDDVGDTVLTLFDEVLKLGLDNDIRCGIGILEGTERMETRSATLDANGEVDLRIGMLDMTVHPLLKRIKKAWKSGETRFIDQMTGNDVVRYYTALNNEPDYPFFVELDTLPQKQYHNSFSFSEGILFAFSPNPMSDEAAMVLDKFARVFGQTYRRYRDLLKAEVQAIEAIKQSSLDRVRGKIASMRSPEDLDNITPLIWSELEILEVPFIRCGVFIIDESRSSVQAHLTTPDGKPIGALNLPFDANELTYNTVEYWKKNKVYIHHWNKEDFLNWMQSMISLGQIQTTEQYQGYTKPPESLDLHFIPFKQGMLYVGNIEPLIPEKIELVETLAEAFSIAYARYEDFVHLEEAKTRVEKTLSELKSAQSQLIHAEKMASLGELTAGIAHEIQNPLNFVNNFSEVSVDLIEEMNEEMESGDTDEVKAISNDLKQNLEKITYHGQRASGIVKGMLEHSRTSKGHKELTDINELADEYLRLAYHGLRAKDKSFNADFKTDLDETLPKVKVVPQDIGRVLLNLINNAFYAVSAKALATADESFKPLVVISTTLANDHIEIRVKDNGDGIPDNIKDKIFQPFFTTKATGEGTGLGLSLSFDILTKGHGGELKVKSKAGEGLPAGQAGTEFIIKIPIDK